jgi:Na+-transporting NADH:ubiquinone oxidoreductase subunit NqrB
MLYLIFAKNINMESTKKNTGLYWILFLLSVAAFFLVLFSPMGAYCSMVLPFNTTFFAKALDLL